MNVVIIYNKTKDINRCHLNKLTTFLTENNVGYTVNPPLVEKINQKYNFVITLGGDGTVMHGCKYALFYNIPIIGINIGKLGFLTQIDIDNLDSLKKVFIPNYVIDERIILEIKINNGCTYFAINDVVIARSEVIRLVDLDLYCNGQKVLPYRSDGIIISTPTGSTAYSLAAGGPIVEHSVNGIIVTPISSHSLKSRSIIFNGDKNLKVVSKSEHKLKISVDGNVVDDVYNEGFVEIKQSKKSCKFLNVNERSYLKIFDKPI